MNSESVAYSDYSHCSPNFVNGVEFLNKGMISQAHHCFEMAYEKTTYNDKFYNKYASFCGYARVINGDRGGLSICREVARNERRDGDVFYNLAKSEWYFKNRKRTVDILLQGIGVDRKHPGIRNLCKQLPMRKRTVLGFLPRDHALNNIIGKWFRK